MHFLSETLSLSKDPVWPWHLSPWGLPALVLVGLALLTLTVWTYYGVPGAGRQRLLVVLCFRLAALVMACLVLLRPSLVSRDDLRVPSTLIIVADGSESMTIRDAYDNQSRWDYQRRLLAECKPMLQQLQDDYNVTVRLYRFAEDIAEFDAEGKADGKRTDFGQALESLYQRHGHERDLRGILIVSDGADNGTRFPALGEAARWRSLPCPIHTFGIGKPTTAERQRDIALTGIQSEPTPVPVKGKMAIKGTIDAPGFENATVNVHLLINDKEVRAQQEVLRKSTDNEVRLATDAPDKPGEIKVTLKVDPLPGEVILANNEVSTFVTVTQEGISVLLVDKPRFPEPQLIYDTLSADPRMRVDAIWLRTDEPSRDEADLFQFDKQRYDVIILGDLTARRLTAANPNAIAQIEAMVSNKGAGLLMMGGYQSFGNSDWTSTPMASLLPIKLNATGQAEDLWAMKPTRAGLSHYLMRLMDDPKANETLWSKLPKLDGMTKLGIEKGGATVLAVRADTGEPVLVSEDYGEGRTLAFAGDTTYRWQRLGQPRSMEGVEAHAHFWKQVVFWLAKRDKAEGNAWVKPDARRVPAGSKLGFSVGLRGKGGIEAPEAHFDVRVVGPGGLEFPPVPTAREQSTERGTFWKTDAPGEYRLVVKANGKDVDGQAIELQEAAARFLVYQDDAELVRRAADYEFLNKLAAATGGKSFKAEELPRFLEELQKHPVPQAKPKADLWPDWRQNSLSGFRVVFFLLFIGLLCGEWLLRRWWGMV
jgi:uncharacterized membrane protein